MAEKLSKYELMVVLKPLLPDDLRKSIHKDTLDLVKSLKGEIVDTDVWGKRYLAYEIQGHKEGYYMLYQMDVPGAGIAEIKRQLELRQEILRFMIVKINHLEDLSTSLKKKEMEVE